MNQEITFIFPPARIELDGCLGFKTYCKCGSNGRIFKKGKCLNPNCMNYEGGFPSKNYDSRYAYYDLRGEIHFESYKK